MTGRHNTPVGSFQIDSMPSQTQVALCHGFFVAEDHRGKGQGHALKQHQANVLRQGNYDYALCTVAGGNTAQKKVLGAAGWVRLTTFRNRRSSETTEIWGWAINHEEKV